MAVLIEHRDDPLPSASSAPAVFDDRLDIAVLAERVEQRCVLRDRGEYKLSSGKTSSYYYDGKRALLAADLKFEIARAVLDRVSDIEFSIVGGVAVGSVLLSETMSALASFALGLAPIDTFYVRQERKDWGTGERTFQAHTIGDASSARSPEPILRPGMKALVVDDVVTTGKSLKPVFDELEKCKVEVMGVSVIVDRMDPDAAYLREQYDFRPLFEADDLGRLTPAKC